MTRCPLRQIRTMGTDSPSSTKMTYVILVIDGSMSIKEVKAGSRLSEVDLLDDQKTMPAVRNGFRASLSAFGRCG